MSKISDHYFYPETESWVDEAFESHSTISGLFLESLAPQKELCEEFHYEDAPQEIESLQRAEPVAIETLPEQLSPLTTPLEKGMIPRKGVRKRRWEQLYINQKKAEAAFNDFKAQPKFDIDAPVATLVEALFSFFDKHGLAVEPKKMVKAPALTNKKKRPAT